MLMLLVVRQVVFLLLYHPGVTVHLFLRNAAVSLALRDCQLSHRETPLDYRVAKPVRICSAALLFAA